MPNRTDAWLCGRCRGRPRLEWCHPCQSRVASRLHAERVEAARAYDAAAIALFGEFARPNFADARVAELLERTQVVATARRRESREVLVAKEA